MTGFTNRITPVNITSNSSQPFIIPADGAGTYMIGYDVWLEGGFLLMTEIKTLINGVNNDERKWIHVDRYVQETEVSPSRTMVEQLNNNDIITFQTTIYGNGGLEYYRGMAWIMKIA